MRIAVDRETCELKAYASLEVVEKIYLESGERPGDVQELCNALWSITEAGTSLTEEELLQKYQIDLGGEMDLISSILD